MKKKKHYWFIQPLDIATNKPLSDNLPAENAHEGILCADGEPRNLWECPRPFITTFATFNDGDKKFVSYRVFHREGLRGAIREWKFKPKKPKTSKSNAAPKRKDENVPL